MTQAQTERTAGKWKLSPTDDTCIIDAERNVVAEISGDYNSPDTWPLMEANARFIVTACNAHDELVAALQALLALNDNHSPFGGEIARDRIERAWDSARAALSQLEGRA